MAWGLNGLGLKPQGIEKKFIKIINAQAHLCKKAKGKGLCSRKIQP
jgi:hypothetical protein